MTGVVTEKIIKGVPAAKNVDGIVGNKVFVMKPAHHFPGGKRVHFIVYPKFNVWVGGKCVKVRISLHGYPGIHSVGDNLNVYTAVSGAYQRTHHNHAAFIVVKVKGRHYYTVFCLIYKPYPFGKRLTVVGDDGSTFAAGTVGIKIAYGKSIFEFCAHIRLLSVFYNHEYSIIYD